MSNELMEAHREWATRPEDERFETMQALGARVGARRALSDEMTRKVKDMSFLVRGGDGIALVDDRGGDMYRPTHWAFGQIASLIHAPAGYMRSLPAEIAVDCLNHGLENTPDDAKILVGEGNARAVTSPTYGRIWDADVFKQVERIIDATDGRFFNPKARVRGGTDADARPSGLYASDRDIFMFFIDGGSVIDGGGERDQLNRGFFVWNSEVGAAALGIKTFYFRKVCGNHIVWDAEEVAGIRLVHTRGAPHRFVRSVVPMLNEFVSASARPIEAAIRAAKAYLLDTKDEEEFVVWAKKQGFETYAAEAAYKAAITEEGQCDTLWDAVNGFTAVARTNPNIDMRTHLDTRAGRLMELVRA